MALEDDALDRLERAAVALAGTRRGRRFALREHAIGAVLDEALERGAPATLADREGDGDLALRAPDRVVPVRPAAGDREDAALLPQPHHHPPDAARGGARVVVAIPDAATPAQEGAPPAAGELDGPAVAVGGARAAHPDRRAGERRVVHRGSRCEAGLEEDAPLPRPGAVDQRQPAVREGMVELVGGRRPERARHEEQRREARAQESAHVPP